MAIIEGLVLVIFVIVAIILVLLVLIQDEGGDSLGGIFAGSSNSAFGSRTSNVVTRITGFLGAAFLILAVFLAFVYRTSAKTVDTEDVAATPVEAAEEYNYSSGADPAATPLPTAIPSGDMSISADALLPSPEAGD